MKSHEGVIDLKTADRLKRICDEIDITFLYPVVCRIDVNQFDSKRLEVAGSGLEGSSEYLIRDLDELEVNEILFLDFDADNDFRQVVTEEYYGYRQNRAYYNDPKEVLDILERRCNKDGIQIPISAPQPQ